MKPVSGKAMERWFVVSAFFQKEEQVREAMIRILRQGIPRDLIEAVIPEALEKRYYSNCSTRRLSRAFPDAAKGAMIGLIVCAAISFLLILSSGGRNSERLLFVMLLGPNIGVVGGGFFGLLAGFLRKAHPPRWMLRALEGKGILVATRVRTEEEAARIGGILEAQGGVEAKVESTWQA